MTRVNAKSLGPMAKARRAKTGKDMRMARKVRALVADRDGHCRIGDWELNPGDTHDDAMSAEGPDGHLGVCDGKSEWAHLGDKKRFKTRGLPPEERHTTAGSLMLCAKHHRMYDTEHTLHIVGDDADLPLEFRCVGTAERALETTV